jgi:hypothetical protein
MRIGEAFTGPTARAMASAHALHRPCNLPVDNNRVEDPDPHRCDRPLDLAVAGSFRAR